MTQRSNSTLDRDHRRAIEHRARLALKELSSIDWETVETFEIQEYLDLLDDLESECEDEQMCESISVLKELLEDLLD